jgi:hypothetical protein
VVIPVLYMLLVSLVIRACIATGGLQGLTTLLSPDWEQLTRPAAWLEASCQVGRTYRSSSAELTRPAASRGSMSGRKNLPL